jgi:hypothetical protein
MKRNLLSILFLIIAVGFAIAAGFATITAVATFCMVMAVMALFVSAAIKFELKD